MAAPVLPAETKPCARPSRTRRLATRIELSRLARTALAALSSMVTRSLACTISMGRDAAALVARQFLAESILSPDQDDLDARDRAARIAPSTSVRGA